MHSCSIAFSLRHKPKHIVGFCRLSIIFTIHLGDGSGCVACFDHLVQFVLVVHTVVRFGTCVHFEVALIVDHHAFNVGIDGG